MDELVMVTPEVAGHLCPVRMVRFMEVRLVAPR
jgi:hypothetical protein